MGSFYPPSPVPTNTFGTPGGGGSSFMSLGPTAPHVASVTPTGTTGGSISQVGTGNAMGGANSSLIQNLINSLTKQSGQARTDQLAQYQNLMNQVKTTTGNVTGAYDNASALLANQGVSEKNQIANQLVQSNANTEQDSVDRGIGNTTIRAGMLRGNQRNANDANLAVDQQVAQNQAGLSTSRANAMLGLGNFSADSILSKNVQGPDLGMYANLLQSLGANAGQMGQMVNATSPGTGQPGSGGIATRTGGGGAGAGGSAGGSPTPSSAGSAGGGGTPAGQAGYNAHAGSAAGGEAAAGDPAVVAYYSALAKARFAAGGLLTDNAKRQIATQFGLDPKLYV